MSTPSREVPIDPVHAALLIVDVQNKCGWIAWAQSQGTGPSRVRLENNEYRAMLLFNKLTIIDCCVIIAH